MCFRDLIAALQNAGVAVNDSQVRWAITSGKIDRPPLDGSLRFVFSPEHVEQLKRLFAARDQQRDTDRHADAGEGNQPAKPSNSGTCLKE
jgi:hypothetical protein